MKTFSIFLILLTDTTHLLHSNWNIWKKMFWNEILFYRFVMTWQFWLYLSLWNVFSLLFRRMLKFSFDRNISFIGITHYKFSQLSILLCRLVDLKSFKGSLFRNSRYCCIKISEMWLKFSYMPSANQLMEDIKNPSNDTFYSVKFNTEWM